MKIDFIFEGRGGFSPLYLSGRGEEDECSFSKKTGMSQCEEAGSTCSFSLDNE